MEQSKAESIASRLKAAWNAHDMNSPDNGKAHPPGSNTLDTLAQAVVFRFENRWRIRAFANVEVTFLRIGPARASAVMSSDSPDGGTIGIGLTTAQLLSAEGAKVIVIGRNPETLASAFENFPWAEEFTKLETAR